MSARSDPAGRLKDRLAALPERLQAQVRAALAGIGAALLEETRRRLADDTGPAPSRPGEPPRDPAGRLAATLLASLDQSGTAVTLTAAAPYAPDLEYGTRTMAPRPFLRPAGEAVRPAALAACRDALAQAAEETR